MTKRRLRKLYEVVRAAAHGSGTTACEDGESDELAAALDEIIDECDHASEARLVEWAMSNGYPDFDTVLRYGR
jgi:hypothetical protein